ncbi:MAG: metal-dependent transcriptional regulator [Promethearchaeota archaeon]
MTISDLDYKVIEYLYRKNMARKVGEIALDLDCPHSTIGSCIKRLKENGYVEYQPYKYVLLTKIGKEKAIELIRHAQLLEVLLHETLGLNAQKAHQEASKIKMLFSCEIINKICEKFNHPEVCPCGEKILNSETCYCPHLKE